jgi:ribosomal protein S24E
MPITVDQRGINTILNNKNITFDFIYDPHTTMINEVREFLIKRKEKQICFLKEEVNILNVREQLGKENIQLQIKSLENQFHMEVCNDLPNAFWDRKQHVVSLPYENDFKESQIPTKARPAQMNQDYLDLCKKEIESLLEKRLIRPSKSPWSCTAFYVNKAAEKERGVPRLVINYKPLNKRAGQRIN